MFPRRSSALTASICVVLALFASDGLRAQSLPTEQVFERARVSGADAGWDQRFYNTGFDGTIHSVLAASDGRLYAAGEFTVTETVRSNNIAVWDGGRWSVLGEGTNGRVNALAEDAAGNIIAAGVFTEAGGAPAGRVARWDGTSWTPVGAGLNAEVHTLLRDSDGGIVAGGNFVSSGGRPMVRVARWDGDSWQAMGAGFDNHVYTLAHGPDGSLYAGGAFTASGGDPLSRLARWNGSGWEAFGPANGVVMVLATDNDGNMVAAGNFSSIGGESALRIALFDGSGWSAMGPGLDRWVHTVITDRDGAIIAGGGFRRSGLARVSNIARWDGQAWQPIAGGMTSVTGDDETVYSLARDRSGDLVAGGRFERAGGEIVNRIARWDGSDWHRIGTPGLGVDRQIDVFAQDAAGNLYAGGNFLTAGMKNARYLARWDGTEWHPLADEVFAGSVRAMAFDASGNLIIGGGSISRIDGVAVRNVAQWDGQGWAPMGEGLTQSGFSTHSVAAMVVDRDGYIVAGGEFQRSGATELGHIARWNGSAWEPLGGGMNASVWGLVRDRNGDIIATGTFTEAGGTPANRIARWDGTEWHALGDGLVTFTRAITLDGDGNVVVGRDFQGNAGQPGNRVSRWDGEAWSPLGLHFQGSNLGMSSLWTAPDGTLYGGDYSGWFRLGPDGWEVVGGFSGGWVMAMAASPEGHLFLGGRFDAVGPVVARNFAVWQGQAPTSTNPEPERAADSELVVLHGSYPNPFQHTARLHFTMRREADVHVEIFDMAGRRVAEWPVARLSAGAHAVPLDGSGIASGLYLYRITAGTSVATGRLVIAK